MHDKSPAELLHEVAHEAAALAAEVAAVEEAQWVAPPRTSAGAGRGGSGGYSDPTADVVADVQRLRLRMAVIQAERRLVAVASVLQRSREELARAARPYEGGNTGAEA